MTSQNALFSVEAAPAAIVVAPLCDVGPHQMSAMEMELRQMTLQMDQAVKKNVVVDFRRRPHFGSNLLSVLLRLWHRVRERGGVMILCNLQPADHHMLAATHLDVIWPSTSTLAEALDRLEHSHLP